MSDLIERLRPQTEHDLANVPDFLRAARWAGQSSSDAERFRLNFGTRLIDAVQALSDDLIASDERLNAAVEDYNNALAEIERARETFGTIEYVAHNCIKDDGMKTIWDLCRMWARTALGDTK